MNILYILLQFVGSILALFLCAYVLILIYSLPVRFAFMIIGKREEFDAWFSKIMRLRKNKPSYDSDFLNSNSIQYNNINTDNCIDVNPANGLPMVGYVDVRGNPYGTNIDH